MFSKSSHKSSNVECEYSYTAAWPVNHFVTRTALQRQIREWLQTTIATRREHVKFLVIRGSCGAGKSQLVWDYVRTFRQDYSYIFVVDASLREAMERDYQQIYRQLLNTSQRTHAERSGAHEAIDFVRNWSPGIGKRCLFVFDGADDVNNGRNRNSFELREYLPCSPFLDVIITTRSRASLAMAECEFVDVGQLLPREGAELFLLCSNTTSSSAENNDEAMRIAKNLGGSALAITLAGAYLVANPHKSIEDYVLEYRKIRHRNSQRGAMQIVHDCDGSVLTALEMAYAEISKSCSVAARLLNFLRFFNNDDISPRMLISQSDSLPRQRCARKARWQILISPELPAEEALEKAFGKLATYALVLWREDQGSYSMHGLVHTWNQHRVATQDQREYIVAALEYLDATCSLARMKPAMESRVVPHVTVSVLVLREGFNMTEGTEKEILDRLVCLGEFMYESGRYCLAYDLKELEYQKFSSSGAEDKLKLARVAEGLAYMLQKQNRHEAAEEMRWRALKGYEESVGRQHVSTVVAISNLAHLLGHRGKYEAAEEMYRWALKGYEQVFGASHPCTLMSVANLAHVMGVLDQKQHAALLYERAVAGFAATLGRDHSHTVKCDDRYRRLLQGYKHEGS